MRSNQYLLFFGVGGHNFLLLIWYLMTHRQIPRILFLEPIGWPYKRTFKYYIYFILQKIISKTVYTKNKFDVDNRYFDNNVITNTYCSHFRTTKIDESDDNFISVKKAYTSGSTAAQIIMKSSAKIDTLFVFNGRWVQAKSFIDCLTNAKLVRQVIYLDAIFPRGGRRIFSSSIEPWQPHCRLHIADDKIRCENMTHVKIERSVSDFFHARRFGLDRDGKRFSTQEAPYIQKNYDLAGFTSSIDEQIGLFPHYTADYVNQIADIFIAELAHFASLGYEVCVRHHPNMIGVSAYDKKLWDARFCTLRTAGVDVFDELSEVSSYSIIDNTAVVLTMGSTIGAEARFVGKPVYDFHPESIVLHSGIVKKYDRETALMALSKPSTQTVSKDKDQLMKFYRYTTAMTRIGVKL